MSQQRISRRKFLKKSTAAAGATAVGIYAFPRGLQVVEALAAGATQVTRRYPPMRLARVADLVEGQPLDFR